MTTSKTIVAEKVNESEDRGLPHAVHSVDVPAELAYATENDRQRALQVVEDLIQRTTGGSLALYEKQRARILQARIIDRDSEGPTGSVGPFLRV